MTTRELLRATASLPRSPEAKACFEWCGAHAPPPPESTVVTRIFGDGDGFFCTRACRDAGKALNPRTR